MITLAALLLLLSGLGTGIFDIVVGGKTNGVVVNELMQSQARVSEGLAVSNEATTELNRPVYCLLCSMIARREA